MNPVLDVLSNHWLLLFWGLLCAQGILCSFLRARDPRIGENPRLHLLIGALASAFLWGMLANYRLGFTVEQGHINPYQLGHGNLAPAIILALPIGVCWFLFAAPTIGFYLVDFIPGLWMGDHALKAKKTYDQAEAAVKSGELDRAALIYIREMEANPKDPAPRLLLADLWLAKGEREKGIALLREAAALSPDAHAKAPILFRISDLARDTGNVAGARKELETFLATKPVEPYAGHARERLARLA